MVTPYSKVYTTSTLLFYKYVGANVSVTNSVSHFSMFVPTKITVKLANGNTRHAQLIGIVLFCFTNCPIIYPVVPVYYFRVILPTPSHQVPSNFKLVFKELHMNHFNIVTLLSLKVVLGDPPTRIKTI